MNDNFSSIKNKAIGSIKWAALMEIVSRTASPITLVVLARLLSPTDFGEVGIAMIVISFVKMFWDAGLSKALVQSDENTDEAANVVFWSNILLGIGLYLALYILAPTIARFFHSSSAGTVLRVLGFQIILASLSSVHRALFVRKFDFKKLFLIKLLTAFFPAMFSIPMAFYGYGVWALVAGSLSGQILNTCLLWSKSKWRPQLKYNCLLARRLYNFGFWILLESFGGWLIIWGDNLIVGKFLSINDLGIYRTGWNLVTVIFGLILNAFLPVLYPTFSRLKNDQDALKSIFDNVNRVVLALAIPMGIGLLLIGSDIAMLLFGQKWEGLGFVIGMLGLMHGIAWTVGVNSTLYQAMGRPDLNAKLMYFQLIYYLPAYYISSKYGLEVFTVTRVAVAIIAMPIHIFLCVKVLGQSPFYLWHQGSKIFYATGLMAITIFIFLRSFNQCLYETSNAISLFSAITIGIIVYVVSIWFMEKSLLLKIISKINAVKNSKVAST